jgi:hypothetical protein
MQNGSDVDSIPALHNFISPFLSGRDFGQDYDFNDYSKWSDVVECFLAIFCLLEDGTFKPPQHVTGVFAKMEYLCRGVTLYDGLTHISDFNNNPYL